MGTDTHGIKKRGWIGFDLDGTLAHYDGWKHPLHIGDPVVEMVREVHRILREDTHDIRIFTARVSPECLEWNQGVSKAQIVECIQDWCEEHLFGQRFEVTHEKDGLMKTCYDDRSTQVQCNTGHTLERAVAEAAELISMIGTTGVETTAAFRGARKWLNKFAPAKLDPPYGGMTWEKPPVEPPFTTDPDDPRLHERRADGQSVKFLVLSKEELAKRGFVRPLRHSYVHTTCGATTNIAPVIAETYASDPSFYGLTYCCQCGKPSPVGEFRWTEDGNVVGS